MANDNLLIPQEYLQHADALVAQFNAVGLGWELNAEILTKIVDLKNEYNLPSEAIIDPVGFFIYMKYRIRKGGPVLFKCGQAEYIGDIRVDIQIFLIHPEHYTCAITKKDGCCDNPKPKVVILANTSDVRRWTNNGGR